MNAVNFNPIRVNYTQQNVSKPLNKASISESKKFSFAGANILANQNIAFMSKNTDDMKSLPNYDKSIVADEPEGHYSYFLRNNPEAFYLKNGTKINNFLRTGELEPINEDMDDVPEKYRKFLEKDINEKKDYNRSIVDSVEILDSMMESKMDDAMVVYRYAPADWVKTAKDGKLKDEGFFATFDVRDEHFESDKGNTCYEVWIQEGTPYLDLANKNERLFPRGRSFDVLDDKSLVMNNED